MILFLEDEPVTLEIKKEYLEQDGKYTVISCYRIDLAKKQFQEHKDNIKCIVTDLNLSPEPGIDPRYWKETNGTELTGWTWVYHYVYPVKIVPIVVYSHDKFINDLKRRIEGAPKEERNAYNELRIKLVPKGDDNDEEGNKLMEAIEEAIREGNNNE